MEFLHLALFSSYILSQIKNIFLQVFSKVRVTRSLVLYVRFVDRGLSFCTFSFGHALCCLFFFDILIPITPLVSSNSSYIRPPSVRIVYSILTPLVSSNSSYIRTPSVRIVYAILTPKSSFKVRFWQPLFDMIGYYNL